MAATIVHSCREHHRYVRRDRRFLELALSGHADLILTGDADLLSLHPWRSIAILSPTAYLQS